MSSIDFSACVLAIVAMVIAFVLAVCLWRADSEGRRWRLRAGSCETSALIAQKECDAWKAKAVKTAGDNVKRMADLQTTCQGLVDAIIAAEGADD